MRAIIRDLQDKIRQKKTLPQIISSKNYQLLFYKAKVQANNLIKIAHKSKKGLFT